MTARIRRAAYAVASPTVLTLRHFRAIGYRASVVERNVRYGNDRVLKQDHYGFDVEALKPGEPPTLIQCTTAGNAKARMAKLTRVPTPAAKGGNAPAGLENTLWLLRCGWRLYVQGWTKQGRCREWAARLVSGKVEWHETGGGQ